MKISKDVTVSTTEVNDFIDYMADADWYLDDDPAEAYNNLFAVINILFTEEKITEDTRRYIFDNIRRMGNAVHAEQAVAIKEEYKRFCEKKVSAVAVANFKYRLESV